MDDRFTIDTDAKAEWAIRQIKDARKECERLKACCYEAIAEYEKRIDKYDADCERDTAYLLSQLSDYMQTVKAKETKTQYKYALPSGDLIRKKASYSPVKDEDKLREWLIENAGEYLKPQPDKIDWAALKAQLVRTDAGYVLKDTGEVVEGISEEEQEERFDVK